jgi:predicted ester cyclase
MSATGTQTNTEIVRATIDAINAHDIVALRGFWTAATVERFPDRTYHGPDELAAYFQGLFDGLPDLRLEILASAENGETVFLHWRATGTHTGGPFFGINPTGKALAVDGMDQFTIRDGKIAANFVVFDQMEFGRQLGLLPSDGSAADRALKAAFNGGLALKARLSRSNGGD